MAKFKVESSSRQNRMRQDGSTYQVYSVWLKTDKGASGQVEVPADVWDGDELLTYLDAEAAKLDKAFSLVNGG